MTVIDIQDALAKAAAAIAPEFSEDQLARAGKAGFAVAQRRNQCTVSRAGIRPPCV